MLPYVWKADTQAVYCELQQLTRAWALECRPTALTRDQMVAAQLPDEGKALLTLRMVLEEL